MTEAQTFDHLEPIPVKYALCGILASFIFFLLLSKTISAIGAPKSVDRERKKWDAFLTSWIHSVIAGTWVLLWYV